jgi:serine phosphatase RsbU (regulator of sigma subunit)
MHKQFKFFTLALLCMLFSLAQAQKTKKISIKIVDEQDSLLNNVQLLFPGGKKLTIHGNGEMDHIVKDNKELKLLVDSLRAQKDGYNIASVEFFMADDELLVSMEKVDEEVDAEEPEQEIEALQELTASSVNSKRGVYTSKHEKKPIEFAKNILAKIFSHNKPVSNTHIVYKHADYYTDLNGKVMLPEQAAQDSKLYIEGYKVVNSEMVGDEIKITTEELTSKESYVQNLSLVANEIEQEQNTYEQTSDRLTNQINQVLKKLKTDQSLTLPEKKELQDYLKLLTNAMERNDQYYLKNKTKRDSLLFSLNRLLLEKDSLNKLNQLEIAKLQAEKEAQQAEYNKKMMMIGGVAVFLLVVAGTFIFLAGKLQKQKKELERINAEVLRQKEEISNLYNEITENITAAKVIQNAILPSHEYIRRVLPQSFVLYHPRDVVSGDFYWCHQEGNRFMIAAIDCTGHGVAGAFMTFIGYKIMNQIALDNKGLSAGEILTKLNHEVLGSLNQYQSGNTNAGMDIALCIFEEGKNTIEFAGANNPLYVLRNGEMLQTKADKQGIGGKQREENYQFSTHMFETQSGDNIFIFSDGYAGQIGGPTQSEKFMYGRFRDTLAETSALSLDGQEQELKKRFVDWKGKYEQLDDVTIIGIRV